MRHGIVLFTSDRGITPAQAAKAAEDAGFDTIYVPEHTHIPIKRHAAHPTTGDETLPDDRYMRTLDPWVSLATAAAVTTRVRLSTAVALPVEHDPKLDGRGDLRRVRRREEVSRRSGAHALRAGGARTGRGR